MTTLKKIIVLNNPSSKNFNGSAILTLNNTNNGVFGTLKTFNITNSNNLVLGLAQNKKQVFKQSINLLNGNTYNFKLNNLNLNENLSCVLVEDHPTQVIPLIWGSDNKNAFKNEIVENLKLLKTQPSTLVTSAPTPKTTNKLDLDEMFSITEPEVENLINTELTPEIFESDKNNVELPNYNNFNPFNQKNESLLSVLSTKTIIDEEMENIDISSTETFYENICNQITDLFNKYPAETNLENLIPNSKWVKIDYENNGNCYVLGLIYEDITLKYICYGVPGTYSINAPNGMENYSQWLPLNPLNPTEDGYWVMYQDAITGESVLIDAI